MTDHPLVLVGFEPDWQALYVEGAKVAEGHKVRPEELVEHTAAYVGSQGTAAGVRLETTHVEDDEMDEYGEFDIPNNLSQLAERAPGAYGRISA